MGKYLSLAIAMAVLVSAMLFPMQASAANLKSGEKVTGYLSGSTNKYEITVKEKGTLTISVSTIGEPKFGDRLTIRLSDAGNNSQPSTQVKATKGIADAGNYASLRPRDNEDEASGTFSYNVTKGTYYLQLSTGMYYTDCEYVMTFTDSNAANNSTSKSSTETKTTATLMTATLKAGATLQLGTDLSASNASKVTWKSGKASVAKVSSTGKVTAVAKGTATITATYGKTTFKIKIIVS